MNSRRLEWGRALCIWLASWGLYVWLGGQSLQFLWWLCSAILLNGALLQGFGPSNIAVQRDISPTCLYAGEEAEITVTIQFKSWMPLPWIMLTDRIGEFTVRKLWFPGFRRSVSYSYSLRNLKRGNWPSIDSSIEWGDLFGWFRSGRTVVNPAGLIVLPRPLSMRGMLNLSHGSDEEVDSVHRPSQFALPGHGLRDYIPGDSLNRIHWKNSARLGKLQTFLPQPGRNIDRCIILITSQDGYPNSVGSKLDTSFEDAIAASAGLLYSSAVTLGTPSLWIGGMGRSSVRPERTRGEDYDMLIPLASVPSQPGNGTAVDILERAAADEDHTTELHVVTGTINPALMKSAIQILSSGRKVSIYCTSPIPVTSIKPTPELALDQYAHGGMLQPGHMGEVSEDPYFRAGGRLLYISGEKLYEITTSGGGGDGDGKYQQLTR
ncbi:Uncharacterized conserved protein, DUF58 family, contains vWF domain [Paenibacillus uliginis N3/975]|uniref:Uncharacterized conserved protein, DUF58 family, contains vWF domain n=1 Tax=Paenibacillus uliginis N3/975 TaxID=1313296 RepID=A0A1X7HRL9_9BACL|nr:DUF58 domain-containing protein [Paenibacillus uliginis]SMF90617.1 Uncharacterized conserved protein, DUF58 family, contains vWF domain [Paenibacillus uliginis N3/975]